MINQQKVVYEATMSLLNAVDHYDVEVSAEEVRVTMDVRHANVVDSESMSVWLERLQRGGIVAEHVRVVWCGMRNGRFVVWCARGLS